MEEKIFKKFKDLTIGDKIYRIDCSIDPTVEPKLKEFIVKGIKIDEVRVIIVFEDFSNFQCSSEESNSSFINGYYSDFEMVNKDYLEECKCFLRKLTKTTIDKNF